MIRYAITAGNHGSFLKRDRGPSTLGRYGGISLDVPDPLPHTLPLPFDAARPLLEQIHHLAQNNVDYIQLREKHLPAGELAALACKILDILNEPATVNRRRIRLLINGRADVALATGAHGVHLPATPGGLLPAHIHRLYRSAGLPAPVVSQACHTVADVRDALQHPPDLILFSPVFGKSLAGQLITPPTGLAALREVCHLATPLPVLALGGITEANTAACLDAGAAGIAAIRLFQPA